MSRKKVWMSWSSGKDSAYALSILKNDAQYEVTGLLTLITDEYDRVSMHSTRRELVLEQAKQMKLPLYEAKIPKDCSNSTYEECMREVIDVAKEKKVEAFAFGDLHLQDVREYRESMLRGTGIHPLFPIWGLDTTKLANCLANANWNAIITCVDNEKLSEHYSGMNFDSAFLEGLPEEVDRCGERGEFHTFVNSCPLFESEIPIKIGEKRISNNFVFTDIVLVRP